MATFTNESLVLVTGANGHVAQHVVDQLLHHPKQPRVRATVRSERSADIIKAQYGNAIESGRLEVVLVPDITVDGAFDEAVQGTTHIAHVASPILVGEVSDFVNDLIKPAVNGTTGVLSSAAKVPGIQKIAITGSTAAITDLKRGWRPGYVYTDKDFNPVTIADVTSPSFTLEDYPEYWRDYVMYCSSKAIAERAAWDFMKKEKTGFGLSVLCPAYIFGKHVLPLHRGAETFSISNALMWKTAVTKDGESLPPVDWPNYVHVRQVAEAHIKCLEDPQTDGKRYMLAARDSFHWSDVAGIVRKRFGERGLKPPVETQDVQHYTMDASKALRELGLGQWVGLEECVVETIEQALEVEKV